MISRIMADSIGMDTDTSIGMSMDRVMVMEMFHRHRVNQDIKGQMHSMGMNDSSYNS